ncbi:MAG: hypothetical protein ACKO96_41930, partial [Flammeovirgaceae bacterium]
MLKPYQSLSALMALIFYYHILPSINEKNSWTKYLRTLLFGVILFLLYYYHYVYLALAFFLELIFEKIIGKKTDWRTWFKKLGVYTTIFIISFIFFFLPHIIAVFKVGSSHTILFGSTEKLELIFLSFPLILGLLDVFKNIHKDYTFKTLILVSSLVVLFVINLFIELLVTYNIHVFKIQHIIAVILLPHTINAVYEFVRSSIQQKYELLIQIFCVFIFFIFTLNEWVTYCYSYKQNSSQFKFWQENAKRINASIDLRNKIVLNLCYYSDIEYGSLTPNYLFLPTNNDYGS